MWLVKRTEKHLLAEGYYKTGAIDPRYIKRLWFLRGARKTIKGIPCPVLNSAYLSKRLECVKLTESTELACPRSFGSRYTHQFDVSKHFLEDESFPLIL